MSAQPQKPLFDAGPADGNLTDQQKLIYEAALEAGPRGGITASEAGALIHSTKAVHTPENRCIYCKGAGRGVLEALKAKGLLKRRKTGVYQPVRQNPVGMTHEIPF